MNILVLNAGSSTLKFGCYQSAGDANQETRLCRGVVAPIGSARATLSIQEPDQQPSLAVVAPGEMHVAIAQVIQRVTTTINVDVVGCRVVHGGAEFHNPVRVTPSVLEAIRALARLAPLHNPLAADAIESVGRLLPGVPVVAVFDTAFHTTLPDVAATYALPFDLAAAHGLRRYGFHGISHRYVSERLLECSGREAKGTRLITCHLGNGASICALRDGVSIDISMGLTPMEGLVMGSRCGDLDPGLVLYLMQALKLTAGDVDDLLNHRSGLLGVSGSSGDVRELERAAQLGDEHAKLALEVFAYRASKYIGAYCVALEGLDAVAFTGGIGEHAAAMRARICDRLAILGVQLDAGRNAAAPGGSAACLSPAAAPVQVWMIPTDEELQIAREVSMFREA